MARSALQELKKTVNPNEYPGAPLLGVQGIVIALHGASSALGVANGIRGAVKAVESDLLGHIAENIKKYSCNEITETEENNLQNTNNTTDENDKNQLDVI